MARQAYGPQHPVGKFRPIRDQRLEKLAVRASIGSELAGGCVDVAFERDSGAIVKRMGERGLWPDPFQPMILRAAALRKKAT